jgi:hypothetical protein
MPLSSLTLYKVYIVINTYFNLNYLLNLKNYPFNIILKVLYSY